MAKVKKKKEPLVIEHEPKAVQEIFVVEIAYKSGQTSTFNQVIGTVTDHTGSFDHKENIHTPPVVPYENYMIIQQADRNSTYVNMDAVEELTIGVETNE